MIVRMQCVHCGVTSDITIGVGDEVYPLGGPFNGLVCTILEELKGDNIKVLVHIKVGRPQVHIMPAFACRLYRRYDQT